MEELSGLTVLVGAGDVGKSSILRALRAAFLNDGEDEDIRHGQKKCEVELNFGEVRIVWWKERGKGGSYSFERNGAIEHYTKTAGAVPEAIARYLGVGVLEVDSTTELTPQLSDQHDAPFILWETGSKRARILGKATRLDVVVSAQMQCKKELDQAQREEKRAGQAHEELLSQQALLPDYKGLEKRAQTIEEDCVLVEESTKRAQHGLAIAAQLQQVGVPVDTDSIQSRINYQRETVDRADVRFRIAEGLQSTDTTLQKAQERLKLLREEAAEADKALKTACRASGLCPVCGGLLSHERCTG